MLSVFHLKKSFLKDLIICLTTYLFIIKLIKTIAIVNKHLNNRISAENILYWLYGFVLKLINIGDLFGERINFKYDVIHENVRLDIFLHKLEKSFKFVKFDQS